MGTSVQTKAFEGQSGDAQPYQSVARAAEDLKGLLTGSARINDRKGVGTLESITSVPEVGLSTRISGPKGPFCPVKLWLHIVPALQPSRALHDNNHSPPLPGLTFGQLAVIRSALDFCH